MTRTGAADLDARLPPPGSCLEREYKGRRVIVMVPAGGFEFDGQVYRSVSAIASEVTGIKWNGFLFFNRTATAEGPMARSSAPRPAVNGSNGHAENRVVRCAIYTRKFIEEGLQQDFNSVDAQREAAEAFITSQRGVGWLVVADHLDDGGYAGANMDRPP
ncbi:MAG: DUF2924 domain-containing protein [Acetobacteraceae bacterium]